MGCLFLISEGVETGMSGFKKPTNSEFLRLQNELENMKSVLSVIQTHLINKDIVICTATKEVAFRIEQRNIPHLFGIYYKGGGKALWKDFKRNRLNIRVMQIKEDGTTFQKLNALRSFRDLFFKQSYLTGQGKYERLTFDSSIRTDKLLLAIGFKYSENDQIFYPNTVLNLKSKIIPKGEKVLAIYTEDCLTGEVVHLQRRSKYKVSPRIKQ